MNQNHCKQLQAEWTAAMKNEETLLMYSFSRNYIYLSDGLLCRHTVDHLIVFFHIISARLRKFCVSGDNAMGVGLFRDFFSSRTAQRSWAPIRHHRSDPSLTCIDLLTYTTTSSALILHRYWPSVAQICLCLSIGSAIQIVSSLV